MRRALAVALTCLAATTLVSCGIETQNFGALTVDDFEVIDHGPEVPSPTSAPASAADRGRS